MKRIISYESVICCEYLSLNMYFYIIQYLPTYQVNISLVAIFSQVFLYLHLFIAHMESFHHR